MKFLREEGFRPSHNIMLFDKKQVHALMVCIMFSIGLLTAMRFFSGRTNLNVFRFLATFDLLLLSFRLANYKFLQRTFSWGESLPFHLCNFNVLLCFIAAWTKNPYLYDFLFAISPFAALSALLFPDIEAARYPHFNFRSIEFYTSHTLLILMPLIPVLYFGFRPSFAYAPVSGLILLIMLFVAGIAAYITDGNYMFLKRAPDKTPLKKIETRFGKKTYRISLILSFCLIYILMHLIAWIFRI